MVKVLDDEEEGNAYATDDNWTLEQDDKDALSTSIRQHALNLKGEEEDIDLDDDIDPVVPLGRPSASGRSSRSFNSLSDQGQDIHGGATKPSSYRVNTRASAQSASYSQPTKKPAPSALRSSRRFVHAANDDQSVGGQSKVSFSGNAKKGTTNQTSRSGTTLRALIALTCLGISIVLAVLFGNGIIGRWITNTFIKTSTTAKEAPTTGGIPGALGLSSAYNSSFQIPDVESMNIILPAAIENSFADWRIPFPAGNRTDLPVYWNLYKSGGTVVQRILGQCLGLVEVSNQGANHPEPNLQILENPQGTRYINVDSTTAVGLQRAVDLQLVQSSLADVMFTPLITQSAAIFTPQNPGRFFSIFRHPLERSMGIYQAAKITDPTVASMSLTNFAAHKLANNEMVRTLTGKGPEEDLSEVDLLLAMEILRRKCVVGLVARMEESMVRFHGYFGWYALMVDGVSQCQSELLAPSTAQRVPLPREGSDTFNIMMAQNRLDLRLYEYALYMYDMQGGNSRTA